MLPPLQRVPLTTELRKVPAHPRGPDLGNPALYENLAAYMAAGYGEWRFLPGDPYTAHTLDGSPPPKLGPGAKRILRFGTMGDFQLMDDESPTRVGFLDDKGVADCALRPHDAYICHLANAAVRTMNAIHRMDPLSIVFVGGDTLDSAQSNEADWAISILRGGQPVECDSGDDDDLISGPGNDPKDPFVPEGLLMPWKWVPGNHDMLIQGNALANDQRIGVAEDNYAPFGTRDYSRNGTIIQGPIVVDSRRRPLSPQEVIAKVAQDGDGHGITSQSAETALGTFVYDVPGTPVRFLVIDSVSKTGGVGGVIRFGDYQRTIRPTLDQAKAEQKWVLTLADNASDDLGQAAPPFGVAVPDPIGIDEWKRLMGDNSNVLFSIVRSYAQSVRPIRPVAGHAFWEILNAAVADFPHQVRIFELWDGDNGFLMLRATCVDIAVDDDALARDGLQRALTDQTSTWRPEPDDTTGLRNVELWIRKP